jgi:MFS family permease
MDRAATGAFTTLKELLADHDVRVAALLYALLCGTLCGFGGMWNIMLAEAWRYQESEAIIIASAFFVGIAAGSPLIGLLAKRFGSRATMLGAMWITLPAFVVWIVVPIELSMWFDACNVAVIGAGLTASVLAFDIASHRLPSHRVASAIAIVNLAGMAAGAVLEILPAAIVMYASDTRLHQLQLATAVFPLMIAVAIVAMRLVPKAD